MQASIWKAASAGDLDAIKTALRIMERRAKLFGLDAPTNVRLDTETLTFEQWSAEVAELLGELIATPSGRAELARTLPGGGAELARTLPGGAGRALLDWSAPEGEDDAEDDEPWSNIGPGTHGY